MAITPIAKRKMISRFKAISKKDRVETGESVTPKTAPQQCWNAQAKLDRVEKRAKSRDVRHKLAGKFVSVSDRGSRQVKHEISKNKANVGRKIFKAFAEEAPTNNVGGGNIAGINPPAGPSNKALKFALARRRRCGCK